MMRASLYIDLDNMLGYCYALRYPFEPEKFKKLIKDDHFVIAKAYGNIENAVSHFDGFLSEKDVLRKLQDHGIKYIQSEGKKNSADLALSLDALQELTYYDKLFIVSSDNDFNPLLQRVKKAGITPTIVKMFKPKQNESNGVSTVFYGELCDENLKNLELDSVIIAYRNTLERILKMPLPSKDKIERVFAHARKLNYFDYNLYELSSLIPEKDAFKILKTSAYKGGIKQRRGEKITSISVNAENAFCRQCKVILKRANKENFDDLAFKNLFL